MDNSHTSDQSRTSSSFDYGAHTVLNAVTLLLESGKFSDLTLICRKKQFLVHRPIVCARSPVWAAASEGEFKEAKTRTIAVDIVNTHVLQLALTYLYTGIYDDTKPDADDDNPFRLTGAGHEADAGAPADGMNDFCNEASSLLSIEDDADRIQATAIPLPHGETQRVRHETEALPENEKVLAAANSAEIKGRDGCELTADKSQIAGNNARLRINTLMYIFADYYQIPELKILAVKKFAEALEGGCYGNLGYICHLVYETAPTSALHLRSCLANAIASNGQGLVQDTDFMEAILTLPELLRDYFASVVRQHLDTSEERDAALSARLEAQDSAKEANRRGQEDKQSIIAQVNQARRCRHCALENNVRFEHEGSHLGRSEYSFRCKCRTRY